MNNLFNRFLPDDAKEKECFFQCSEPRGSIAVGIAVMVAGFIIVPVFVRIASGSIPFSGDAFLKAVFDEASIILNYSAPTPAINYVVYFVFALLAGMTAVKTSRSVILAPLFVAVLYLIFFFLAYFILGAPIDMNALASGSIAWLLVFGTAVLLPVVLGSFASTALFSLKKCYVMGKGTVLKK